MTTSAAADKPLNSLRGYASKYKKGLGQELGTRGGEEAKTNGTEKNTDSVTLKGVKATIVQNLPLPADRFP
jgi:hypothetical protein